MKIGELIYNAAIKNGVAPDHAGLKDILALTGEVDKDIVTAVEGLMSLDAAKSNGKLKAHFISGFADGQDKKLYERMEKMGLSKEDLDAIKGEFDSRKKVDMAIDKLESMVKDAKTGGAGAANADDVKKYKDEIKKLNDSIAGTKSAFETKEKELINSFEQERVSALSESEFSKFTWAKHFDASVRPALSKIALEAELAAMGATLVRDPATKSLKLVQAKDTSMDYFDSSNKPVIFTSLVDKIMTDKNFKAVSAEPGGDGSDPGQQTIQGQSGQRGAGTQKSQSGNLIKDLLSKSMADQDKIQ